ncbi:hypothetical protein FJQ54_07830 [Sandaracinobacter neustonicus]|uniref:Uncharacterized protein n=1 Tax=Sandaracinobacter neustonicus TaxID=1715348 RepID=A0A501XNR9_9SPHN|nr:hypothetical protein [Sandaracinobacter neustonicus]TPE61797.1 hypothetical protein FJQ54_07830 [Sandaracinobacter neustonicus]
MFFGFQAQLNDNMQGAQLGPTAKDPSLLAGKVVDEQGRPLVATHASKGKVRYRYYVSRHLQHGLAKGDGNKRLDGLRIPARELEQVVLQAIVGQLKDPIAIARQLGASTADPKHLASIVSRSEALLAKLDGKRGLAVQAVLGRIVRRVAVREDAVELTFEPTTLGKELGLPADTVTSDAMHITIPARIRRSGLAVRFILDNGQRAAPGLVDAKFLAAIALGHSWWQRLTADTNLTVTDLARVEGLSPPYLDRILRLTFLAPDIVEALLDGTAPADLNLESTKDLKRIAPSWSDQRRLMGVVAQRV